MSGCWALGSRLRSWPWPPPSTKGARGEVAFTATNKFDVGSLKVNKVRDGEGADVCGAGPFEAQVARTHEQGEKTLEVVLPNDGKVTLTKANDYRATVEGIYAGADCKVVETKDGGADKTEIGPNKGRVTAKAGDTAAVTITNTFEKTVESGSSGKLPMTGATVLGVALAGLALIGGGWATRSTTSRRGKHAR